MVWLLIVMVLPAGAQTIVRGPYLQNGTTEGVTIMWRTSVNTSSKVWYGTSLGALNQTVTNASLKTNHTIQITGLPSGSKYFYQVGMTNGTVLAGGNAEHYFVTSPGAGSTQPVRIWILGDCGTANSSARNVKNAYLELANNEKEADIWLMLGDNAYNDGTDSQYQNAIFNMYPEILRNKVLWSTRGNHEKSESVYYGIFDHPTQGEGGGLASGTEHYYSFDYGNIHFICLNSQEGNFYSNPSSAMYQWLEQDLADTMQNWIIAFWHHPPYSKGSHNSDGESQLIYMRQNALPILEAGGVDLVLTGHSHSYERSYFLNGHYGYSDSFDSNIHVVQAGDGREDGDGAYQKSGTDGAVYTVAGTSGKTGGGSLNHPVKFVSYSRLGSVIIDVSRSRLHSRFLRDYTNPIRFDDYFTIESGLDTVIVDDDAPGDPGPGDPSLSDPLEDGTAEHPFDTINEAINMAANGGTIFVEDGIYKGETNLVDFQGKSITIKSVNGPENCIILDEVVIKGNNNQRAQLEGFTISRGFGAQGIRILNSSALIKNCRIVDCSAYGIYADWSNIELLNCGISGNQTNGIYCKDTTAALESCEIAFNEGDVLYGDVLYFKDCGPISILNCTIFGNVMIGTREVIRVSGSDLVIENCIIRGHGLDPIRKDATSNVVVSYCNIEGGHEGQGNFDLSALFVDRDAGNLRLLSVSPCIDAGDPAYVSGEDDPDFAGNRRVIYGRVDMGAFEMVSADFNLDGYVNMVDMAVFTANWPADQCAEPDWCGRADLMLDGVVGLDDMLMLLGDWMMDRSLAPGD